MIKTFFRNNKYAQDEVHDVVIQAADSLYIRVCPSFTVDTRVEFRLITSDGLEELGYTLLPAFSELALVPDKFVKPGILDIAIVELNEDTPAKVWPGISLKLYSLDYCFGAHDRIAEIIDSIPEIKQFLYDYPALKETVDRIATITFDPLDVGLGGE